MTSPKKSILIFSEAFLPPAYLPRVRYFCSYFVQKGWDVHMVYEASENTDLIPDDIHTLSIDYYRYKKGILARIEWLFKFFINLIWDYKGYYFEKKSRKFTANREFDIVFTSSCFTFPITTAYKVAKNKNVPLFVDLRDIAEQSPNDNHYIANKPPKLFGNIIINIFKRINIKRRNKVLKVATGITTVSPWHVETLSKYNKNTVLIYNGFDESTFFPQPLKTAQFTISYFGRVYNENMRDPRLLLESIRNLADKKLLNASNTVIKWFIDADSKNVIQKLAFEYNVEDFVEYHEFISPDKLNEEMSKSSILLTLSNISTKKQYFGIMTTKFFESIGVNRPILCVPDNNDNLSALIKNSNCGLVSSSLNETEVFIRDKFSEWQLSGYTKGYLTDNERMNFSRQKGAEILENIFLNAIQ